VSVELQFLRGKKADRERHRFCRIVLLEHIAHDSRFLAVAAKTVRELGFDQLHAAAAKELAAGGSAHGEAVTRYMAAWEKDLAVGAAFDAFVRDELQLSWPWLAPDLTRWLFFDMKNRLPRVKKENIEFELLNADGVSGGRYQTPEADKMRLHVEWFYRHRVKNPPDSIPEIARGPVAASRETVRSGIKNAAPILGKAVIPNNDLPRPQTNRRFVM
jgi:hypothetical protein